jgi:hypothetical protein
MNGFTRLLAPLTAAVLLLTASAASATDYCVAPNTSCGGTSVATFEAALDLADNANDADRIFLGTATYTAPVATGYSYAAQFNPVEVIGAGRGKTILTSPIGGSNQVLYLSAGTGSSIHDLTVRIPQNAAAGLSGLHTNADARRIEVIEAATQTSLRRGLLLESGADLEDSTVTIGGQQNTWAVQMAGSGTVIRDSTLEAKTAAAVQETGGVERSVMRGRTGLDVSRGTLTITDTLIEAVDGIFAWAQAGESLTVNADGVTLIGSGSGSGDGVYVSNSDTATATINLVDAVLRGYNRSLARFGDGGGHATLNASYSDYNPGGNEAGGPGNLMQSNVTNAGDARFVDPGAGDYRLRFDSPLIDAGEPGAPTTTTDLAGGARLVDGDAAGGARRDIGAYEYQAQAPVAAITGPAAASAGQQVTFSGTGSSDPDPGDTLTYAWNVDGQTAGGGAALTTSFQAGTHRVELTVTDPIGRQATADRTIAVTGASGPPGGGGTPPPPGADTTAPVLSDLLARPARVRRGRPVAFRFGLDEAAAITLEIRRARPGRRVGAACRKPSAGNRKRSRCTRYVRVATVTATGTAGANTVTFSGRVRGRALPAGRYRARLTATDGAGNRSAAHVIAFRVRTP